MAIKSSGQLSLRDDIRAEFSATVPPVDISLRDLSSRAGKATPDAMSEFYGYSAGTTTYQQICGFDATSYDRACVNVQTGRFGRYRTDNADWASSYYLWTDIAGTNYAPIGYYAEERSLVVRYWSGSAFYSTMICRV